MKLTGPPKNPTPTPYEQSFLTLFWARYPLVASALIRWSNWPKFRILGERGSHIAHISCIDLSGLMPSGSKSREVWYAEQEMVAACGREGGGERRPLVEARHCVDSAILLPLKPNLDKFHCLPTNLCSPKISLFTPQFGKTIWTHAFVPFKQWEALPTI